MLHKVDGSIRKDYQRKTYQEDSQLQQWMDDETWFTAGEAKEYGFIDRIFDGDSEEDNTENRTQWDLSAYANTPETMQKPPPVDDDTTEQAKTHKANLLRRVNMLDAIAS